MICIKIDKYTACYITKKRYRSNR